MHIGVNNPVINYTMIIQVSKANQITSIIRKYFTNLDHIIFPQLFKFPIQPLESVQRRASKLLAKF